MTSRLLIAYILIAFLVAGGVYAVWRTVHNSERNVRRRERRARRERYEARLMEQQPGQDEHIANFD
jgi:hypothetical protein